MCVYTSDDRAAKIQFMAELRSVGIDDDLPLISIAEQIVKTVFLC